MGKIVPIGVNPSSAEASGYWIYVCCNKRKRDLEEAYRKNRILYESEHKYCHYYGERLR